MTKEEFIEKNLSKTKLPNKVIKTIYDDDNLQVVFDDLQKNITDRYNSEYKLKLSDITFRKDYPMYEDGVDFQVVVKIEQSEEKYQEQLKQNIEQLSKRYDLDRKYELQDKERKEKREKEEYLRLKLKFENK